LRWAALIKAAEVQSDSDVARLVSEVQLANVLSTITPGSGNISVWTASVSDISTDDNEDVALSVGRNLTCAEASGH
jgi:hypothetical protein